jgi:serine protease Do
MKRSNTFQAVFALLAVFAFTAAAFAAGRSDPTQIDEKKIEDITKAVAASVVRVEVRDGFRKVATGVVIDKDGSIVTTALISPHDEAIEVVTADGKRLKAEFKGFDTQTQLALIQVKEKGLAPIAVGKSGGLKPGAWIGVVGLSPENTPAITQGIVSSVTADRLRLNVWVVPGSSGSPVVNGNGQMVGLVRGAYGEDQPVLFNFGDRQVTGSYSFSKRAEAPSSGMALAVPMDVVASVAGDLKKSGRVERGWLGVTVPENEDKVVIETIAPKSPAELAKLKVGDILLKIDGKEIPAPSALGSEIRSRKPGQDITIRIERDGKPMDVKVKLGEYTEAQAQQELESNFPQFFNNRGLTLRAPGAPREPDLRVFGVPYPPPAKSAWEGRKFIGASLQALTRDLAEFFGLRGGLGVLVAQVETDSPAKKAGVKVGDVILKADGRKIEVPSELIDMIQGLKKGDKIKLDILRDKKAMSLDVEVAERESDPEEFSGMPGDDLRSEIEGQLRRLNEGFSPDFGRIMGDARNYYRF